MKNLSCAGMASGALRISLCRGEGPKEGCFLMDELESFEVVDVVLYLMARTAPEEGSDKVDFSVMAGNEMTYDFSVMAGNEMTYTGIYLLSQKDKSAAFTERLQKHMLLGLSGQAPSPEINFWISLFEQMGIPREDTLLHPVSVESPIIFVEPVIWEETLLSNRHCRLVYNKKMKRIAGRDLQDLTNEPAFYTTNRRGLPKAWHALALAFSADTSMLDAAWLLGQHGANVRTFNMED